ncbi:MAG TPA: hypothetical protein PKY54_09905, partial [Chitinophagales bacterium]|nr:hypothetical protein [Chitinophagales bacterium]
MRQRYILFFFTLISILPSNAQSTAKDYFMSAIQREKDGDKPGAILDYTKSINLDATHYQTFNNRGILKNDLQDYKGALEDYSKAI